MYEGLLAGCRVITTPVGAAPDLVRRGSSTRSLQGQLSVMNSSELAALVESVHLACSSEVTRVALPHDHELLASVSTSRTSSDFYMLGRNLLNSAS